MELSLHAGSDNVLYSFGIHSKVVVMFSLGHLLKRRSDASHRTGCLDGALGLKPSGRKRGHHSGKICRFKAEVTNVSEAAVEVKVKEVGWKDDVFHTFLEPGLQWSIIVQDIGDLRLLNVG